MSVEDAWRDLRDLTVAECRVLYWVCRGLPRKQIAEKLFVTPRTVYFHLGNIYSKLTLLQGLNPYQRQQALARLYCPLLLEEIGDPELDCQRLRRPDEEEIPQPSEEILEQVQEDEERGLIPIQGGALTVIPPDADFTQWAPIVIPPPERHARWVHPLLVVLGGMVGAAIVFLVLMVAGIFPPRARETPVPTWIAERADTATPATGLTPAASNTPTLSPQPSPTPPPQPTHTPYPTHTQYVVPPTYTPYPTFTPYVVVATSAPVVVVPTPHPEEQSPPPGSVISAGQAFTKGGVTVMARSALRVNESLLNVEFEIRNTGGQQIVVRWRPSLVHLRDSLGRVYHQRMEDNAEYLDVQQFELSPGKTKLIHGGNAFTYASYSYFEGPLPADADYLIFTVDEIAGLTGLNWRYDLL